MVVEDKALAGENTGDTREAQWVEDYYNSMMSSYSSQIEAFKGLENKEDAWLAHILDYGYNVGKYVDFGKGVYAFSSRECLPKPGARVFSVSMVSYKADSALEEQKHMVEQKLDGSTIIDGKEALAIDEVELKPVIYRQHVYFTCLQPKILWKSCGPQETLENVVDKE